MGLLTGPAPGAATIGLCLGYGRYLRNGSLRRPAKISCEANNFVLVETLGSYDSTYKITLNVGLVRSSRS
jgi:hypothetical protein